jgi:hypothetical protein
MGIMGQGSRVMADMVVQIAKVLGSSIAESASGDKKPVQYHVIGVPGMDFTGPEPVIDEDEANSEVSEEADAFVALGVVSRPLPPSTDGGSDEHTEVVCLRQADGLLPIAVRDVRLRMGGNAPNEGTIALVGYAGGYHSISPVDNDDLDKGAIQIVYCPYDFSGGVAQKAHVITLDPTSGNESISLVHADGQAIFLQNDGSVQLQTDGVPAGTGSTLQQSSIKLEPGKITLQADQIVNNGSVYVGDPLLGVPLLAGVLSAPCPRFFVAPTP